MHLGFSWYNVNGELFFLVRVDWSEYTNPVIATPTSIQKPGQAATLVAA
jgi:hypothetical protein